MSLPFCFSARIFSFGRKIFPQPSDLPPVSCQDFQIKPSVLFLHEESIRRGTCSLLSKFNNLYDYLVLVDRRQMRSIVAATMKERM